MHDKSAVRKLRLVGTTDDHQDAAHADRPAFQPTIHMDDIFREMIRAEIRNGRLSAWRRRRIVQYAAQLKLSAVEAGRLIEQCRVEFGAADDVTSKEFLKIADEPASDRNFLWNIAFIVLGLAMILIAVARS